MGGAIKSISDDAKLVGSAFFAWMQPGKGKLVFHMVESRPTDRTSTALDELVSANMLSCEIGTSGSVTYRPIVEFRPAPKKLVDAAGSWPLTEKIKP